MLVTSKSKNVFPLEFAHQKQEGQITSSVIFITPLIYMRGDLWGYNPSCVVYKPPYNLLFHYRYDKFERASQHASTVSINRLELHQWAQSAPPCAHYAPTMRPLTPQAVLKLYRWAQSAPAMRPLCAHNALAVSKPLRGKSVASIRGNAPTTTRSCRILS